MNSADLSRRKAELVAAHGPWTAHNLRLANGLYTIGPEQNYDHHKLARIVQTVADLAGRPLAELRVLDLGCLEGLYALEFGLRGATVVGIEGRKGNWAKAEFARAALELDRVTLHHADIRTILTADYGRFDVILCLGVLYHFDQPEVFRILEALGRLGDLLIIDTHVARRGRVEVTDGGHACAGAYIREYAPGLDAAALERKRWASIGNPRSFWFIRESLVDRLARCGFTTVFEVLFPAEPGKPVDRVTWAAIRGRRQEPLADRGARPAPVAMPGSGGWWRR